MNYLLKNAKVYTSKSVIDKGFVLCIAGKVAYVGHKTPKYDEETTQIIDCDGYSVSPGFIDMHLHGGGGFECKADGCDEIDIISNSNVKHGTTSILLTLTLANEDHLKFIDVAVQAIKRKRSLGNIIGIHLEGPFVNEKKKGAIAEVVAPSLEFIKKMVVRGKSFIKMVTLAPELEGIDEVIDYLIKENIIVSIGHSEATYDQCMRAMERGVSHYAHVYNAASVISARDPGVLGAALYCDAYAEIIADGHHVHRDNVSALIKLKNKEKICLVTDAIRVTGTDEKVFTRKSGTQVEIKEGRTWGPNGILVGSILTQNVALKNIKEWSNLDLHEIIKFATKNPAQELGIYPSRGALLKDSYADIVVFDSDFNIIHTFVNGELVYTTER